MELNKKQIDFLFVISMEKKECIRFLGRKIYATDVSCYNVRDKLLSANLIYMENIKNKEVPHLTKKGKRFIKEISNKRFKQKI